MKKGLRYTLIITTCLVVMAFNFLVFCRKPWIGPPLPGVRLEPRLPVLLEKDVPPDSGWHDFTNALAMIQSQPSLHTDTFFTNYCDSLTSRPMLSEESLSNIQSNHEIIVLLRSAASKGWTQTPCESLFTTHVTFLNYTDLRIGCRLLLGSSQTYALTSNMTENVATLTDGLKLLYMLKRGGKIMDHSACFDLSSQFLIELLRIETLTKTTDSTREGSGLLRHISTIDEPYGEAFRYHLRYTTNSTWITELYANRFTNYWCDYGTDAEFRTLALSIMPFAKWMGSTPGATTRNYISFTSREIFQADNPDMPYPSPKPVYIREPNKQIWKILTHRDPLGMLIFDMDYVSFEYLSREARKSTALLRLTHTFLAIQEFALNTGHPPERLTELVPDYLEAVLDDPFNIGAAVQYRTDSNNGWTVYSVGANKVDDGGTGDPLEINPADIVISTRFFDSQTNRVPSPTAP